jgi:tight adherence protein B
VRGVRRAALEAALAELVAAVAAPLRAGVPPSVALAAAEPICRDDPALGPLLRDLVTTARAGGSAAAVWLRHADAHGSTDLRFVGQAWALSERTGAPLAAALASSEEVLRARARGRERVAAAAAGPRASMAVLCLLPASGPVVGAAMGVDPGSLYLSSPVATASLTLGVVLAIAAWGWSRWILRRAT